MFSAVIANPDLEQGVRDLLADGLFDYPVALRAKVLGELVQYAESKSVNSPSYLWLLLILLC